MLKRFKQSITVVLTAMLILSCFSGCKTTEQAEEMLKVADETEMEVTQAFGTNENETEPAQESTIKIGAILNETGWYASVDRNNAITLQHLVDHINNNLGGVEINGVNYSVDLDLQDGQSNSTRQKAIATMFAQDNIQYVIGSADYWMLSYQSILDEAETMQVAEAMTYTELLSTEGSKIFTTSNGYMGNIAAAFQLLLDEYPNVSKVMYLADNTGGAADGYMISKNFGDQSGINVVPYYVEFNAIDTDYENVTSAITDSGADAVLIAGTPEAFVNILIALRAAESDCIAGYIGNVTAEYILSLSGTDSIQNAFVLGIPSGTKDPENYTDIMNTLLAEADLKAQEEDSSSDVLPTDATRLGKVGSLGDNVEGTEKQVLSKVSPDDADVDSTVPENTAEETSDRTETADSQPNGGEANKDQEIKWDDLPSTFMGDAANALWGLLTVMREAETTDPADVAEAWTLTSSVSTLYGTGFVGGESTYGIANHVISHPIPITVFDSGADNGYRFWGWMDVQIP